MQFPPTRTHALTHKHAHTRTQNHCMTRTHTHTLTLADPSRNDVSLAFISPFPTRISPIGKRAFCFCTCLSTACPKVRQKSVPICVTKVCPNLCYNHRGNPFSHTDMPTPVKQTCKSARHLEEGGSRPTMANLARPCNRSRSGYAMPAYAE